MTKSELIEILAEKLSHLSAKDVELAIKEILEMMAQTLSK
ncbi:MAG: HU family DNA-binding protein, partial [Colwellia sp.]|nr:HU family DNA-binding protein [Colwellia sp.]